MRRFNIMRPLLILAVAYFANNLTKLICIGFGSSKELASNLGFVVMMIAAILTFVRLNKTRNRK